MKKLLSIVLLVALGASIYVLTNQKNIWEDLEDNTAMVEGILRKHGENLSAEEMDFLKAFPSHKPLKNINIWQLMHVTRETLPENFLALAQMYFEYDFPIHSDNTMHEMAHEGSKLLKMNSYELGAKYFARAFERSKKIYKDQTLLGEWCFFAGYGYRNAGQFDKAIEWFKKALIYNPLDHRPDGQMGLMYLEKAKASLKGDRPDRMALMLASDHIRSSLKLKEDQPEMRKALMELSQINLDLINKVNHKATNRNQIGPNINLPGTHIPNPIPKVNVPNPQAPKPGVRKPFKQK